MEVDKLFLTVNVNEVYHFEADVPISTITVNPALPEGLKLTEDGTLSGVPLVPLNKTSFSFTANTGYLMTSIQVTIIECAYGPGTIIGSSSSAHISVMKDEVVILDNVSISVENIYCLQQGSYDYNITATFDYIGLFIRSADGFIHTHYDYPDYKGSFQIGVTQAPVIKLPSFIPVQQAKVRLPFQVEGGFSSFEISPAAEEIQYNPATNMLTFLHSEDGLYEYTMTVSNKMGSSSVQFVVGVNTCQDSTRKISFDYYTSFFSSLNFYDEQGVLMIHKWKDIATPGFFCAQPDVRYPFKLNENHMGEQSFYYYFVDSLGVLMEFPLADVINSSFTFHSVALFNSPMLYSKQEKPGWMKKDLDEKDWTEGKSGMWGEWEAGKKVYFRYHFTVEDMLYSNLHIQLNTLHSFTVYVNEVKVSQFVQTNNTSQHRVTLPFYLIQKENLLAIELMKADVTLDVIDFDMEMLATQTPSIEVTRGGEVKSIQEDPDPHHPAENAFANTMDYWKITKLPAVAEYTLPEAQSVIATKFFYGSNEDDNKIKTFRLEGVDGAQSVVLLNITSTTMTSINYFEFENETPFPMYRIVIEEAQEREELDIAHLRLLQENKQVCEKKYGIEGAKVGSVYLTDCEGDAVGRLQLKCVSKNYQAVWEEDPSSCVPRVPPTDLEYVDFTMVLTADFEITQDFLKNDLMKPLAEFLKMEQKDIAFVYVYHRPCVEKAVVEVAMRFTVDADFGDHLARVFNERLQEYIDMMSKDKNVIVEFTEVPVVHKADEEKPDNNNMLFVLIIIALSVTNVITCCCLCCCSCKRRNRDDYYESKGFLV